MRKNVTLVLDEEILEKARTIASQKKTTINHIIRDYLKNFIKQNEMYEEAKLRILKRMSKKPLFVGSKGWNREEIYER